LIVDNVSDISIVILSYVDPIFPCYLFYYYCNL